MRDGFRLFGAFVAVICFFAVGVDSSYAGGFALLEQSSEGQGTAFAGATAGYEDGSAVFFNPAAMRKTRKDLVALGGTFISPNAEFRNQGSHMNPALGSIPTSGDNGPNGGELALVPDFYTVLPLDSGFTAGLGVNSPFGLSTQYSNTWVGRYSAIKTDLRTVTISPALSYNITDELSIGAAVNVLYAGAELTNAIDFGTIGVGTLGFPTASALGLLPQQADGLARVKGNDWGVGATAGVSYSFCEGSSLGIAYRSNISTNLRGDADFIVPDNARILTSTGLFTDSDASAKMNLPESIAAGGIWKINDTWSVMGDVQWTRWSRFSELRVHFDSNQPDSVVNENWDNVWRWSIGAAYKPIDALTLRAGFTIDEEPISDKYHRTPRIPGNDRYWMAFGASYNFLEQLRLDISYAHLFVPDAKTDVVSATGDELIGEWDLSIDMYSAQLVYTF